jgi:hypothetical protein
MIKLPETIQTEEQLDELLSCPPAAVIEMIQRLDGDILILGIGGKMGEPRTDGWRAISCAKSTRVGYPVCGSLPAKLEEAGIDTIQCDFGSTSCRELPFAENVIYMAGKIRLATSLEHGSECEHNHAVSNSASRIVVFSTGAYIH